MLIQVYAITGLSVNKQHKQILMNEMTASIATMFVMDSCLILFKLLVF